MIIRDMTEHDILGEEIIRLENVTKRFDQRTVLDNTTMSIKQGQIISIMGESGAGKSTLLNILGFFDYPTSGEYYFNKKHVKKEDDRNTLRNLYMGFVFQSYNLIQGMTVYENIVLPVYYSLKCKNNIQKWVSRIPELLKRFNIEHIKNSLTDYISGGEKQRVCMARAIVCDAPIIISDEPTGNLDSENKQIILNEFKRMNNEGKTIIIVTHDSEVQNIASIKYDLKKGKLLLDEEQTVITC